MSQRQDVDDIVQSFVNNDLSSLDRFGGQADSFSLSPHLAQASPEIGSSTSAKTGPSVKPTDQTTTSKTGPQLSRDTSESAGASNNKSTQIDAIDTNESTVSKDSHQPSVHTDSKAEPVQPKSSQSPASGSPDSADLGSGRQGRHTSVSSTASVSTTEREKAQSFGDRFKKFGKRIASGSKK